jgi:hypothetical protein
VDVGIAVMPAATETFLTEFGMHAVFTGIVSA